MEKNCLIKDSEFANYLFYLIHYCLKGKKNNEFALSFLTNEEELYLRSRYSLKFPYFKIINIGNNTNTLPCKHIVYLTEKDGSQVINGGRNVEMKYHRTIIAMSTRCMSYKTIYSLKSYFNSRTNYSATKEYISSKSELVDKESKPVLMLFRCILRILKNLNYLNENQISFYQNSKNLSFNCCSSNSFAHYQMIVKINNVELEVAEYDKDGKLLNRKLSTLSDVNKLNETFNFMREILNRLNVKIPNDKNFES